MIVLVTDGASTIAGWRTVPEAERCRDDAGIHIFTVGIGLAKGDTEEAESVASEPRKDNVFLVDDFDGLAAVSTKLVTAICDGNMLLMR